MKSIINLIIAIVLFSLISCGPDFLSQKPDKSYVIPNTVENFQALLDNSEIYNLGTPALGEVGSDDYWITDAYWKSISSVTQRNGYIWAKDIYEGEIFTNDWNKQYTVINYTNVAIEGLKKLQHLKDDVKWRKAMGSALFYRAMAFYHVSQLYCDTYLGNKDKLGIPLLLEVDLEKKSSRSTVFDTYNQILDDLNRAIDLLPQKVNIQTQPSKASAFALKARIALLMNDFPVAYEAANSSYALTGPPMDFGLLNTVLSAPFTPFNDEVVYYSSMLPYGILSNSNTFIDSVLISTYDIFDKRKGVYFEKKGSLFNFKGSLNGSDEFFSGIAKGEVLLMLMETEVRLGKIDECLNHLKIYISKRYDSKYNIPPLSSQDDFLNFIRSERRKELVMRGLRWSDLRRYNKEDKEGRLIKRKLGSKIYTLKPNGNNYVLPLPDAVVAKSGMVQNNRD